GCDTFQPQVNGAARFAERLAAGLARRGHEVHVVAPSTGKGTEGVHRELVAGEMITVHRWRSVRWRPHEWVRYSWPHWAARYARETIAAVQPDVVHIQSHIINGRCLTAAAHRAGIRVVATNHTMPENVLEHTTLPGVVNDLFFKWAWWDI